jgi:hypothetical protein
MKSKLIHDGGEKTYALDFDKGDEAASGLLRFARRERVALTSGVVRLREGGDEHEARRRAYRAHQECATR